MKENPDCFCHWTKWYILAYIEYCKEHELEIHPARMPKEIPLFFIKFLTDANDLVLDPFAGSNTTGYVAESTLRRWLSIEINQSYVQSYIGRFDTAAVL